MNHSAIILTEDTGMKLPSIKYDGNSIIRGYDITQYEPIIKKLQLSNLSVPTNDLDNEEKYLKVLKDYQRPAIQMFGGLFNEVKSFRTKISKVIRTDILILSRRYGLIDENEIIIPYDSGSRFSVDDVRKLDANTHFFSKIEKSLPQYSIYIFLLSGPVYEYLIEKNLFSSLPSQNQKFIVVGEFMHHFFKDLPNYHLFSKKGVSRLGSKENSNSIIKKIRLQK